MRTIRMRALPGEPLDGSGRIRIHFFVKDVRVKTQTPAGVVKTAVAGLPGPPLKVGGVHGYIACNRARDPLTSSVVNGVHAVEPYSDDPRGATCPECLATPEFQAAMKVIEELVPGPSYPTGG
jgi:hypothetical protein